MTRLAKTATRFDSLNRHVGHSRASSVCRKTARTIALALRRIAHRLDPDPITSLDVTWSANRPPYVDIRFHNGQRVVGHLEHQIQIGAPEAML